MFKDLDPLLQLQIRLAIIATLIQVKNVQFNYLLEITKTSQGNLSHQLQKLKKAEYINIKKTFKKNYPLTIVNITPKGRTAFKKYIDALSSYFQTNKFKPTD